MLRRAGWVSLCVLVLPACGGETRAVDQTRASEGGEQSERPTVSSADVDEAERPTPPSIAPRWVGVWTSGATDQVDFGVVRFDDVEQPETLLLARGAEDERSPAQLALWSPLGEHLAFVITTAGGAASLWVASAADEFARREVSGLPEITEPSLSTGAGGSLAWIGAETLVVAAPTAAGLSYYRVPVSTRSAELLGQYEGDAFDAQFAASRFGVLYATTTSGVSDLWLAKETGEPLRMGAALSARQADLVWSPDGRSASWWTWGVPMTASATGPAIGVYYVSDSPPPDIEITPDQSPKLGHVHVASDTVVDAHPHGDLVFSNEFGGRALSPEGAGYAYAVHHNGSDLVSPGGHIVTGDAAVQIDNGVGQGVGQTFGFLDPKRFFYSRIETPTAPETEPRALVALSAEGAERVVSTGRYAARYLDGFAAQDRLVFVRDEIDRRRTLWTVDLSIADAEAEVVPLADSIVVDSPLKAGETTPHVAGIPGAVSAPLLLVATTDDAGCTVLSLGCQTGFTVVDFSEGIHVTPLALQLAGRDATWSPDGTAVLAITDGGLQFVPGPAYRGAFPLNEHVVAMAVPQHWPAP